MTGKVHNKSIRDLIRAAAQSGVRLWVEGDRLCYRAPKSGIPEALGIALRAQRDEVIGELSRPIFRKRADSPDIIRYPEFWADFWGETQADPWLRHGTHFVRRLTGGVTLERIVAALDGLTSRHDVLRSKVWCEDGVPHLQLDRCAPMSADIVDLSSKPAGEGALRLKDLTYEAIYSPLDNGQVYRATVLKISDDEYVIAVVVHHFVGDGVTCEMLAAELIATLRGQDLPQPTTAERPLQYSDYLLAMSEWLSGPGLRHRLTLWKEKMRRAPLVSFPLVSPPGPPLEAKAESVSIKLSPEMRAGMACAAAECQVPLPVVLLAAKFAAMSRTVGSTDLVVTVLHWGRDDSALLELVGFTVNCIPVRVSVRPEMSYVDLLTRVNDSYNLARDYQVPWALLRRSFPEIGASPGAPLFNYIDAGEGPDVRSPSSSRSRHPIKVERLQVPAPNDVISADWKTHEFSVLDDGNQIVVIVTYLPSRYEAAAVQRFTDNFFRCVQAIGQDCRQPLGAMALS